MTGSKPAVFAFKPAVFALRLLSVSLLATLATWDLVYAAVQTSLEPRLIEELETTVLVIQATDVATDINPDLTPLQKDFEVLSTQSSSELRIVNGRSSSSMTYRFVLRPKRVGELIVPAISIGGQRSQPLTLHVRTLDPVIKQNLEQQVFFETELSYNPVYVQAQTILSRRLYYSSGVQIYSDLPGLPEIPNAVVVSLGETRSRTELRQGQRYGVVEQRFAIFPEQSGTLTIPATSVTTSVRMQGGGSRRRSGIRVMSEAHALSVLPIPEVYPDDAPWLPATDLSLHDQWTPSGDSIAVGQSLTRVLQVAVRGNTGSVIPPLTAELPAASFKVYPEQPHIEDDASGSTLTGRRTQQYAVIPTASGPKGLPAVSVTWWDTEANQVRVATTTPRRLNITGQGVTAGQRAPVAPRSPIQSPRSPDADAQTTTTGLNGQMMAGIVTGLAAVALLAAVAIYLVRARRRQPGHQHSQRRYRWHQLRDACRHQDPGAMHQTLIAFVAAHFNETRAQALERLREDPAAAELLERLNRATWSPRSHEHIDGESVIGLAKSLQQTQKKSAPVDPLPPLYAS